MLQTSFNIYYYKSLEELWRSSSIPILPFSALATCPLPPLDLLRYTTLRRFRHTSYIHSSRLTSSYTELLVIPQLQECPQSRTRSQVKSMTSYLSVAAVEAQPARYTSLDISVVHHCLLLRAQRRASLHGAKTAIIEESGKLGGTCVNVGQYQSSRGLLVLICTLPKAVCRRR
jgi:hypothetical protein